MAERTFTQPSAVERQKKFAELPSADTQRSTFDMSHAYKCTMDYNRIVPILLQEILPGDTISCTSSVFARLATPLKPFMDNIKMDIHYFFVPNRLVWDNWAYFMGERQDPTDNPDDYSVPLVRCDMDNTRAGLSLVDYFGLPLQERDVAPDDRLLVNAMPFRGYQKIFNEWYRNQNLQPEIPVETGDDTEDANDFLTGVAAIRFRHKRADYFTRALPWPQKGDPVFLPLGTTAPVRGLGVPPNETDFADWPESGEYVDSEYAYGITDTKEWFHVKDAGGDNQGVSMRGINLNSNPQIPNPEGYDIIPGVEANLQFATAATINDLRTAFQVQRMLERDARSGTRLIEIVLAHFNVQAPDYRLQRPEFLGSGYGYLNINPVASTVAITDAPGGGDDAIPQGNLAATGTGVIKGGFTHSFVEHGFLFGLLSGRADLTYQNGVDRMWNRKTRYDYYWPALAHLGEQEILNQEIFWSDTDEEQNAEIWGYQERFAEYRYQPSRITGLFRSNYSASLDVWHLAQDFDSLPPLNPSFTVENAPIDRVIAVPSEPHLLVDCWHEIKATRAMPVYSVPGLVDHF